MSDITPKPQWTMRRNITLTIDDLDTDLQEAGVRQSERHMNRRHEQDRRARRRVQRDRK